MGMRTPITYYGGKQRLAKLIVQLLPRHKIYCEPFFGGGAVFFEKPKSYLEAINDNNDMVVNFYKQVVDNFDELAALVEHSLHSESEHIRAREIYYGRTETTNVERAWAFWLVTNFSFSGSPRGGWKWCNGSAGSHTGIYMRRKREEFTRALYDRLADVQISCRDALEVIKMRDTPDTVFYIDPPYPGAEQKHYSGYTFDDFQQLLNVLQKIKGKFILSNYPSEMLNEFSARNGWKHETYDLALMTANFKTPKRKTEVLVYNFRHTSQQSLFT